MALAMGPKAQGNNKPRQGATVLMAHSYHRCLYHVVYATHKRQDLIALDWQPRLWDYLAAVGRDLGLQTLAIGGIANHIHLLVEIPPRLAVADAVRQLKSCSSKWVHEQLGVASFGWQTGYGAFSIGISQVAATQDYIARQEVHHRTTSFEAEYGAILQKNGIELDEHVFE